jgi:hypothetical protein
LILVAIAVIITIVTAIACGYLVHKIQLNNLGNDSDHDNLSPRDSSNKTIGKLVSIKSCSKKSTTKLSSLRINPYPIRMPGNVSASFTLQVNKTIARPTIMRYKLMKRLFGLLWVTVDAPAVPSDLCDTWPIPDPAHCPESFTNAGIPCSCPIAAGEYMVKKLSHMRYLYDFGLPTIVESGRYWIRVDVDNGHGGKILCHELELDIN